MKTPTQDGFYWMIYPDKTETIVLIETSSWGAWRVYRFGNSRLSHLHELETIFPGYELEGPIRRAA